MRRLLFLLSLFLLPMGALFILNGSPQPQAATTITCPVNGQFNVMGPVICDPEGKPFLPRGLNFFAGKTFSGFVTPLLSDDSMAKVIDGWKLNTLRIVTCPDGVCASHEYYGGQTVQGDDLDAVIAKYTQRKVVVILDYHSPLLGSSTGPTQAQRQFSVTWFREQANKYKNNPYVWFEPFNEPIEEGPGISSDWLAFTRPVVEAVRATGSKNIMVLNTNHYGQDRWSVGGGINPAESAILTYGPQLRDQFGNIVFDIHLYSRWSGSSAADIAGYFQQVHNANLAILIGETWGDANGFLEFMRLDQIATDRLYEAKPKGVGILPWSAAGNFPATTSGFALDINSLTNPTNLTHNGRLHWEWTHAPPSAVPNGFTVIQGQATPTPPPVTSPTTVPTTPLSPTSQPSPAGCTKKNAGDADCNGSVTLTDYAVWRAEYKGNCSTTMLTEAACGDDKDKIGTLMDADFSGDGRVTLVDYQSWRTSFTAGS